MKRIVEYLVLILVTLIILQCSDDGIYHFELSGLTQKGDWTIMIYMAADNDLEPQALLDLSEMLSEYDEDNGYDVILLVDRAGREVAGNTSEPGEFGESFSDTRLYRLRTGRVERLAGGSAFPEITLDGSYEANMGDPATLKKFIQFSKQEYSSKKYALFFWNHGGGPKGGFKSEKNRDISYDFGNNEDFLATGEISVTLTSDESVDLVGFDACFMGSIEVAYQFAPVHNGFSADIMVASPAEEWIEGWPYHKIFKRLSGKSGGEYTDEVSSVIEQTVQEARYDPYTMNAADFASIIVEEHYDAMIETTNQIQTMSGYNLAEVVEVKNLWDQLSVQLVNEKITLVAQRKKFIRYYEYNSEVQQLYYPFTDLGSVADWIISEGIVKDNGFVAQLDKYILFSFAGKSTRYNGFKQGYHGVHLFFPDGSETAQSWDEQSWYNPNVIGEVDRYGNLYWCKDNAIEGNTLVENWFELLEFWYGGSGADINSYSY